VGNSRLRKIYAFLTLSWAILILFLTLTPAQHIPKNEIFGYDKLGHAGIFCIQTLLLMLTLTRSGVTIRKSVVISVVACAIYGFAIEGMQQFIPGRSMDWFDAVANITGSFLALGLFYLLNKQLMLKNI
jgi:VanZ family protein